MIRYVCNKDANNEMEFHGTARTLAADALGMLVLIYYRLRDDSPDDAELFAKAVTRVINDRDDGAFSGTMLKAAAESYEEVPHE